MEKNIQALTDREPDSPALERYEQVAQELTGDPQASASDGIAWVREICNELSVTPLSTFGISSADIPAIVDKAQKSSSMRGNPIELTGQELSGILEEAI